MIRSLLSDVGVMRSLVVRAGIAGMITAVAAAMMIPMHRIESQSSVPPMGRIEGTVWDSVSRQPLGLATVQLLQTGNQTDMRTTVADVGGRFRFDSVAAGEWMVGVWHPRLDSVGLSQLGRMARVEPGKQQQVRLAIPSARSLIRRMCGDGTLRDSLGVMFGTIRSADRQRAVAGMVRVKWHETEIGPAGVVQQVVGFDQTTAETGEYLACGIPVDARFEVQASAGDDSSGVIEVQTGLAGVHRLDLFVERPQRRADTSITMVEDSTGVVIDTVVTAYRRGAGRLEGMAYRDGLPLPGALVTLWGTGLETRSDSTGRFLLATLPLGTHTLEMRMVGYLPLRRPVDILPDVQAKPVFDLAHFRPLDTVRVRAWATRDYGQFDETAFLSRRRRGAGIFMGPEELARENPATLSQLFTRSPTIRMRWGTATGETVTMGSGDRRCTPSFLLDGRQVSEEDFFMFVRPDHIVAMEIYARHSTPLELPLLPGTCGTIVIWTGVRPPAIRPQ